MTAQAIPAPLANWLDHHYETALVPYISGSRDTFDEGHRTTKRLISEALTRRDFRSAVSHCPDPARWWLLDYCFGLNGVTPETIEAFDYLWNHGSWLQHNPTDRRRMTRVIEALAASEHRHQLFSPADRITFDRLPDRFTIYRGVFNGAYGMHLSGRSWTLSQEIAEKFARRLNADRSINSPDLVMEKRISKDAVLFYSSGRGEYEIVLVKPALSPKRKEWK